MMFIGPHPPINFPMFTVDPFLSCCSRRYRMFELDAVSPELFISAVFMEFKRHSDFWNDPVTVAMGLQPPRASIASTVRDDGVVEIRGLTNLQNQRNGSTMGQDLGQERQASAASGGTPQESNSRIPIRTNNNGEIVFTEIRDFEAFIHNLLETVAQSMVGLDSNISVQQRSQQVLPFNADTTGFVLTV